MIEMVMFKAASLKLGLDYAVMHNLNTSTTAQVSKHTATPHKIYMDILVSIPIYYSTYNR